MQLHSRKKESGGGRCFFIGATLNRRGSLFVMMLICVKMAQGFHENFISLVKYPYLI